MAGSSSPMETRTKGSSAREKCTGVGFTAWQTAMPTRGVRAILKSQCPYRGVTNPFWGVPTYLMGGYAQFSKVSALIYFPDTFTS